MNKEKVEQKFKTVFDRLTLDEKKELMEKLNIKSIMTFYNWFKDPSVISEANKLFITSFMNKTLETSYSVQDIFPA